MGAFGFEHHTYRRVVRTQPPVEIQLQSVRTLYSNVYRVNAARISGLNCFRVSFPPSQNDPRNHTKSARKNVSCGFVDRLTWHVGSQNRAPPESRYPNINELQFARNFMILKLKLARLDTLKHWSIPEPNLASRKTRKTFS